VQNEINVPQILNAVRKAGDLFLADYKTNTIPTDQTELLRQLSGIDERCLACLKAELTPYYPEIPFMGDEFGYEEQRGPLDLPQYWLCDSMDGAIQYMHHLSGWTINLVLIVQGQPLFAVIYDPLANELFWAQAGQGAFMNGAPIKPSGKTDPKAMIAVFDYGHQEAPVQELYQQIGSAVTHLLNHFGVVRNYGPHGLQLAYVGAGRIDAFYQQGQDAYNWLAGVLIAREAGAEILTTDGRPWHWGHDSLLVATPGAGETFVRAQISGSNPEQA